MKTLKTLFTLSLAGSLVAACNGNHSNNPAPDIQDIKSYQKPDGKKERAQEITKHVIKEVPVEVEKIVYVPKEVPVEVEKIVHVEREVPVVKEQATLDDKYVVITADAAMKFMEGQTGNFKVLGRPLLPGLKVQLVATGLPEGASFEKVSDGEAVTYNLKWAPTVAMIPSTEVYKTFDIKLTAQVTEAPEGRNKDAIQKLIREKTATVFVLRSQKAPSEVALEGLGQEETEGQVVPFAVIATVHGVDDKSGQKPELRISYDKISSIAGSNLLELDGTKHIVADQAQTLPVYLGHYKWKFHLMYDMKNIAVQPALGKDGKVNYTAGFVPVRMSFKVVSPFGAESPGMLKQLRIKHTTPFAAPKFDMTLNGETLQLTPGETMTMPFKVQSAAASAGTRLDWSNLQTLKGSPGIACQTSKEVKNRLECTLTWNVPCDATDADLNTMIHMQAFAVIDGRNTDWTKYVLKTSRSPKKPAAACTQGAQP